MQESQQRFETLKRPFLLFTRTETATRIRFDLKTVDYLRGIKYLYFTFFTPNCKAVNDDDQNQGPIVLFFNGFHMGRTTRVAPVPHQSDLVNGSNSNL